MSMEIQIEGARAIIKPQENLVGEVIQGLRKELKRLLGENVREIIFDLSTVTVVDSMGIGLLIMCHNSLSQAGGRMEVINVSQDLLEEFRPMRLERHFKISAAGCEV